MGKALRGFRSKGRVCGTMDLAMLRFELSRSKSMEYKGLTMSVYLGMIVGLVVRVR